MRSKFVTRNKRKDLKFIRRLFSRAQLTLDECQVLLQISEREIFKKGQYMARQGEKGVALSVILQGQGLLYFDGVPARSSLGVGELLGEIAYFSGSRYSADVIAATQTQVLCFDYGLLEELMRKNPSLGMKLLRTFNSITVEKYLFVRSQLRDIVFGDEAEAVAHDLRSPLAALKSLLSDTSRRPEKETRVIQAVIARLDRLAEFLIKKDSEPFNDDSGACLKGEFLSLKNVEEMVDDLINEKSVQFKSQGIHLNRLKGSAATRNRSNVIKFDFLSLQRVVSNILDNAIHASKKGGNVRVFLRSDRDKLTLKIQDWGTGIAQELLPKLGRERISSSKEFGFGLGLLNVFREIGRFGGEVKIESEKEKGTSVHIVIPYYITGISTETFVPLPREELMSMDPDMESTIRMQL